MSKRILTAEELAHPCLGDRPGAVARAVDLGGEHDAAAVIRGLLEERNALREIITAAPGNEHWAIEAAANLLASRGVT